jgi:hypothetical protein
MLCNSFFQYSYSTTENKKRKQKYIKNEKAQRIYNARSLTDTDPAMVIKPFNATITSSAVLTKLFHLIYKRTLCVMTFIYINSTL